LRVRLGVRRRIDSAKRPRRSTTVSAPRLAPRWDRPGRGDVARIYISSTYGDLKEHREKVYRALRQLGHDAVAMEDYVAADQRPLAECLEDVAACDLYVGIFAHRYGYVPDHDNPEHRSITELEYRHAEASGIPRLVFLLDPGTPWLPAWMDAFTSDGEGGDRIRALREELGRERLASFFTTGDQLAQQVTAAVTRLLERLAASHHTYELRKGLPAIPARRVWTIPPPVRSLWWCTVATTLASRPRPRGWSR
jgi:hypothetical protein